MPTGVGRGSARRSRSSGPDGDEETYTLVGSSEANAAAGRISAESPIGAALMNAAGGDEVEVVIPAGRLRYRVVEVR